MKNAKNETEITTDITDNIEEIECSSNLTKNACSPLHYVVPIEDALAVGKEAVVNNRVTRCCWNFTIEFYRFASNPLVFGLAVAIAIGNAVDDLVSSFVRSFVSPFIGLAMGGIDLASHYVIMKEGNRDGDCEVYTTAAVAQKCGATLLQLGAFANACIQFLVTVGIAFVMVKLFHKDEFIKIPTLCPNCFLPLQAADAISAKADRENEKLADKVLELIQLMRKEPKQTKMTEIQGIEAETKEELKEDTTLVKEDEESLEDDDEQDTFFVCAECNVGILGDSAQECRKCWRVIDAEATICRFCRATVDNTTNPLVELETLLECEDEEIRPGQRLMLIEMEWATLWLKFIMANSEDKIEPPGKIPNQKLISTKSKRLRKSLRLKKQYRLINCKSWDLIHRTYGGGPAIAIEIPVNAEHPEMWLEHAELYKYAVILT